MNRLQIILVSLIPLYVLICFLALAPLVTFFQRRGLASSCLRTERFLGGSWKELIDFLCSSSCRFNRIDLALDDIDGVLDMDYIRNKISLQAFSSAFRGKKMNGKVGDEIFERDWFELDDLDECV